MPKEYINTRNAPSAIGPYSQAVRAGNQLYISGQVPIDPDTSELVSPDFADQAEQVFKNLSAIAEAAGGSLENTVKLTIFLTDLTHFQRLNDIMARYFNAPYPARAAIGVAALPKNALVEIDAILFFE